LVIEGDELRLEQVLLNLLQNAVKYDPGNSPIQVRVWADGVVNRDQGSGQDLGTDPRSPIPDPSPSRVCVSVADDGIGIPEADQERLFERFYRVSNANRLHAGGMGIGLYVVREIVTLHGGEVRLVSKENEGSTFTVCLPLELMGLEWVQHQQSI